MSASPFVELGLDRRHGGGSLFRLEPSVRIGGIFGVTDRVTVGDAAAEFRLTSGALDACPVRIHVARANAAPCARVELGVLDAQGERIVPARSDARVWTAVAMPMRFRLEASPRFFLELEGAARLALLRDTFVFRGNTTIFETPAFGFSVGAGAGVKIP